METIDLVGYSDRLSATAGETIAFKVSSRSPSPFAARLVRVIHADANPAGPGLRFEDRGDVFATTARRSCSPSGAAHGRAWTACPGRPATGPSPRASCPPTSAVVRNA